jgi:hypothetical protein
MVSYENRGAFFLFLCEAYTPPSPWGAFVILVPVLGALVVTLLVTKFAPEARGHGVPEVMDAVYYAEGGFVPWWQQSNRSLRRFRSGAARTWGARAQSFKSAHLSDLRSAKLFPWQLGNGSLSLLPALAQVSQRRLIRR